MDKIIKTRKEHKCGYCDKTIPKGTKAFYMEGKDPVYEPDKTDLIMGLDGKQVGIKYWKVWYCNDDENPCPSCAAGDFN